VEVLDATEVHVEDVEVEVEPEQQPEQQPVCNSGEGCAKAPWPRRFPRVTGHGKAWVSTEDPRQMWQDAGGLHVLPMRWGVWLAACHTGVPTDSHWGEEQTLPRVSDGNPKVE